MKQTKLRVINLFQEMWYDLCSVEMLASNSVRKIKTGKETKRTEKDGRDLTLHLTAS